MEQIKILLNNLNSVEFPNPSERHRTYKSMRRIAEQTLRAAKAKSVHEMFRTMTSKNVTLRPVKDMCKKLYYGKLAKDKHIGQHWTDRSQRQSK